MNINPDNVTEIQVNLLDLVAFFLIAPEVIGEKTSDEIVSLSIRRLDNYKEWLIPKGLFISSIIFAVFSVALFIPLFYLGYQDYFDISIKFAFALLLFISSFPIFLLFMLRLFRGYVPPGAPRRKWLVAGASLFILARCMTIIHALGIHISSG